jgi:hypothetical protein
MTMQTITLIGAIAMTLSVIAETLFILRKKIILRNKLLTAYRVDIGICIVLWIAVIVLNIP